VLHDVFRTPFETIAQTVGRPAASCRQLARRARQKIADGRPGARFDVESAEHRLVTDKFIAACARGDLDGLLAVLAPDAWGDIDLGPAAEPRPVVTGAENVAANLLRFWGPGSTLVSQSAGGQPVLLGFHGRVLAALLVLRMRGEQVEAVHVIADPAQIGFLSRQLAISAG
jgi:RNA polymerase sigma-70 factor (ECF subfamily)